MIGNVNSQVQMFKQKIKFITNNSNAFFYFCYYLYYFYHVYLAIFHLPTLFTFLFRNEMEPQKKSPNQQINDFLKKKNRKRKEIKAINKYVNKNEQVNRYVNINK